MINPPDPSDIEPDLDPESGEPLVANDDPLSEKKKKNKGLKKSSVLGGIVWTLVRTIGVAILQLATTAIVSRQLSLSDNGIGAIAITISGFTQILSQIGIAPAIIQRPVLSKEHISTAYIASMASGLLQTLAMAIFAPFLASVLHMPNATAYFRVLSLIFVINAFSRISQSRLARDMHFHRMAQADVAGMVGFAITAVTMAFLHVGAWAVIAALIVQSIILTIVRMIGEKLPTPFRFDRGALNDLLSVARGFGPAAILNYVANNADNIVVTRMMGSASLGLYSRAFDFMARPSNMLALSINRVLFPAMARKQDDTQELKRLYIWTTTGLALFTLPLGVVCSVLGPEIILSLLSKKFAGSILPFQILSAGMVFNVGNQSSDAITKARGDAMGRVFPRVMYAGGVIVFAIIGTRWGLPGVALGVILANVMHTLLMARQSMKHIPVGWGGYLRAHQGPIVVGAVGGIVAYLVATPFRHAEQHPALVLIFAFLLAMAAGLATVYFGNAAILGRSTVEIRNALLKRVRGKLKRRTARAAA